MKQNLTCSKSQLLALTLMVFAILGCDRLSIGPEAQLPEFDWLVMGYQGDLTEDQWLTSDSLALFRNDVYIQNGSYVRHSEKTLDKILEWRILEDRKKGKFLSTKIKLNRTENNFQIYRAQVAFKVTDESRSKKSPSLEKGWANWYTGVGYELVQAFSIRVPSGQRLDFPSISVKGGLDDPTALQIWQNRTRYNQNGLDGNIPLSIYLRGDQWMLVNEFDKTPFFPGAKFKGDSLGEAIPGEWLDLVIRMVPDQEDGLVEVYTRRHGEESYSLHYEFKDQPFYGPIDPQWIPRFIDAKVVMGLPSYGIYPSTRFAPNLIGKWLDKGISTVEVHHSEIRLLQFPKGETPMDDILKVAEKKF